jgi:transcriptional regulator with XRE-family HTH domain
MEVGAIPKPRREKRTRATPKRRERQPTPGAVFASDVLATNVRAYRLVRGRTQEELADRMSQLGHGWSAGTVGFAERGDRTLSVDELLALAIVLETDVLDLLDPTGIDGRQTAPVDYAVRPLPHDIEATLPAVVVNHWFRGAVQVRLSRGPGSFELYEVEGHEDEYAECERAWEKLKTERLERRAERIIANEEKEQDQ